MIYVKVLTHNNLVDMKPYYIKKINISVMYMIAAILIEALTFSYVSGSLPQYFMFDFLYIFTVACLLFVIPWPYVSMGLSLAFIIVQAVFSYININLFTLYGDLFSLDLFAYTGDLGDALRTSTIHIPSLIWVILIALIAAAGTVLPTVMIKGKADRKRANALSHAAVLLFICVFTPVALLTRRSTLHVDAADDSISVNDRALYDEMTYKHAYFIKFGSFSYFMRQVFGGTFGTEAGGISQAEFNDYFSAGQTPTNAYTGAIAGQNVITVMLESCDMFFIDEKYTPTLYRLAHEGLNFTNFYSHNKTDYSEASFILGNYPERSQLNLQEMYAEAETWFEDDARVGGMTDLYGFSLPQTMKANGFKTASYFHLNTGAYYKRNVTHKSFGFDGLYFAEESDDYSAYEQQFYRKTLNKTYKSSYEYVRNWSLPESWFLEKNIDAFLPVDSQPFFSFMTTINAHGGYQNSRLTPMSRYYYDSIDDKDFKAIKNERYYDKFKVGLSMVMTLDDSIRYLLDELDARGLADNTTLVFYADHNAYIDGLAYDIKGNGSLLDPAVYQVPAFIYAPNGGLKGIKNDKFTCAFDLAPTLLNLLGIPYNDRYYIGYDAFTDDTSVIISKIGGVVNDYYYAYEVAQPIGKTADATEAEHELFKQRFVTISEKWRYIARLYDTDWSLGLKSTV